VITFSAIEFASSLASVVDGFIVERFIGETAVQSIGLLWPYTLLVKLICYVFMTGAVILCSDAVGKGDSAKASYLLSSSFTTILLGCIPVTVLLFLLAPSFASVLGANTPELAGSTSDYLCGMATGMIPNVLTLFLMPFMQIDNDRKRIPVATGIYIGVNIVLNIVTAAVLGMGIFGIGLSTSVSYFCSLIYLLLHFRKRNCILKLKLTRIDRTTLSELLGLGKIKGINRGLCMVRNTLVNKTVLLYGGLSALTAHSVFSLFKMSIISIPMGMGSAALLLVGFLYAENSKKEICELWKFAMGFSAVVLSMVSVLVIGLAEPLVKLYFSDGSHEETVRLFRIFAAAIPFLGLRQYYMSHLIAVKNTALSLTANILGEFFLPTVLCYALGRSFGTTGLWAAYPVSEVLFWVVIVLICALKKKKRNTFADEFLALDTLSVGRQQEDSFCIGAMNGGDYDRLIEWIGSFCDRAELTKRYAGRIANVLEAALTLAEEGESAGRLKNDIRLILLEDDTLIIRVRNNGKAKQLITREQLALIDDKCNVPELALIYGLSVDVKCITSMNLNNLIIRLQVERGQM